MVTFILSHGLMLRERAHEFVTTDSVQLVTLLVDRCPEGPEIKSLDPEPPIKRKASWKKLPTSEDISNGIIKLQEHIYWAF
jgi:hypothetical protein